MEKDIVAEVTAFDHYTGVSMYTYLDDGTEQFKHSFAKGLVELNPNNPSGYCERGGTALGVKDYYYLKEVGSFLGFGKLEDSSYLKIAHERSPARMLPKMGEIISQ